MTTHELAGLMEHLREGLGNGLKTDVANNFRDAAQAFRDLPNQSLRDFVKQIKPAPVKQSSKKPAGDSAVSVEQLIERVRAAREGRESVDAVAAIVNGLKGPQLKAVLNAINVKAKKLVDENKSLVLAWMSNRDANGAAPVPAGNSDAVAGAYQLYSDLRNHLPSSVAELRNRFEPMSRYPKTVLQEVARKLGYHLDGSKDEIVDRLRQTLEGFIMNRLPSELVGAGS